MKRKVTKHVLTKQAEQTRQPLEELCDECEYYYLMYINKGFCRILRKILSNAILDQISELLEGCWEIQSGLLIPLNHGCSSHGGRGGL